MTGLGPLSYQKINKLNFMNLNSTFHELCSHFLDELFSHFIFLDDLFSHFLFWMSCFHTFFFMRFENRFKKHVTEEIIGLI
jgi:hypothetical protein